MKITKHIVLLFLIIASVGCNGNNRIPVGDITIAYVEGAEQALTNVATRFGNDTMQLSESTWISNLAEVSLVDRLAEVSQVTDFETYINTDVWMMIYLNQPDSVRDQIVIQALTITTPEGRQFKWTPISVDNSGRRMQVALDGLTLCIPISSGSAAGSYTYRVDSVEYLYQQENYLALPTETSVNTMTLLVSEPPFLLRGLLSVFNPLNRTVSIGYESSEVVDSIQVSQVFVNNILIMGSQMEIHQNQTLTLPEWLDVAGREWVTLTIQYSDGVGGLRQYGPIISFSRSYGTEGIPVFTGEDLMLLPRDIRPGAEGGIISIMNDISVPKGFIPFNSHTFYIHHIMSDNATPVTIRFLDDNPVFWEYKEDTGRIPQVSIFGILFDKEVSFINRSSTLATHNEVTPTMENYLFINFKP